MAELSIFQKTLYGWELILSPKTAREKLDAKSNEEIGMPTAIGRWITTLPDRLPGTINYEIDILARTIWAEARSEGAAGMQAVANVVINRANQQLNTFGKSISAVCLKKLQFSCWNPKYGYSLNDAGIVANYKAMKAATINTPYFAQALKIASDAVYGRLADITGGADHYFATYIPTPDWAKGKNFVKIGQHNFLNA